jgi:hypothetical protein
MGFMLAAWPDGHFEFFAQAHQKTLTAATLETSLPCKSATQHSPIKKPAVRRAVKSKENLENLKH